MRPVMSHISRFHLESYIIDTYLAQFEAVVYQHLERTHHDLTNQLFLDHGFLEHKRHQSIQVAEHQVRLVVGCRCEGRQPQTAVLHVGVSKHGREHGEKVVLQHTVKFVTTIGERRSQGLNGDGTDARRWIVQELLQ